MIFFAPAARYLPSSNLLGVYAWSTHAEYAPGVHTLSTLPEYKYVVYIRSTHIEYTYGVNIRSTHMEYKWFGSEKYAYNVDIRYIDLERAFEGLTR